MLDNRLIIYRNKLFFLAVSKNLLFRFQYAILHIVIPPGGILRKEVLMHPHEHTKAVINRLSRAVGHLNAVKKMVEDGRDCSEVLIQLSAVKAEINNVSKVILKDHLEHCIVSAVQEKEEDSLASLLSAIDKIV